MFYKIYFFLCTQQIWFSYKIKCFILICWQTTFKIIGFLTPISLCRPIALTFLSLGCLSLGCSRRRSCHRDFKSRFLFVSVCSFCSSHKGRRWRSGMHSCKTLVWGATSIVPRLSRYFFSYEANGQWLIGTTLLEGL